MQKIKTVLLAGGLGKRMEHLGHNRPKPMVPFGGVCHLIDFSLNNAYRSGLPEVLLLSHYSERKLIRYLLETWWDLPGFSLHFGPYQGITLENIDATFATVTRAQENGTADALIKNTRYIFTPGITDVMVLHADHVYNFDYGAMIDAHRRSGAGLTIGFQKIELEYVKLFGMVELDKDFNLLSFVEKPATPTSDTIFSAVCIFRADILKRYLSDLSKTNWQRDISKDVIPAMLNRGETIKGFPFSDYWEDVGTVERYFRAHMALLSDMPTLGLDDMPKTLLPAIKRRYVKSHGNVINSIVCDDCDTPAPIENSIIYPQVEISPLATIRNSVILPGAKVLSRAVIDNRILLEHDVCS
ncbi:Glucose-1-phosphate adenylyltransferase [Candidatus Paraburkholderia kirkii]|nr:Glucose-1-phosphate adenylyltransferase [Candidatus Paraburkholderia kirkii]